MSRSPSEPENAAPASSMNQEQSLGDSSNTGTSSHHNNPKRWTPTSRSNSSSLLTQALAAHQEAEEIIGPPKSDPVPSRTSPLSSSKLPPRELSHNGIKVAGDRDTARGRVDMGVLEASHDTRISRHSGSKLKSIPAPLGQSDNNPVEASLTTYRDFFSNHRGRGTSLERTEKEKRVQDSPKGTYSTNPGDTALPPSPSIPSSSAALDNISSNPPTDGVRAKYRLWRDSLPGVAPEKAWSIGDDRTDDMLGGQVEKSIKDVMAGIEPNNRSRKASHSMRFFKEGLPDDKTKKRDTKSRTRSKDGRSDAKTFSRPPPLPLRSAGAIQEDSDLEYQSPISPPHENAVQSPKLSVKTNSPGGTPTSATAPAVQGYFDSSNGHKTDTDEHVQSLPSALLAEIRKQHNLTPGAAKGSSFSRSIPVTASERGKPDDSSDAKKSVEDEHHQNEDYFDHDQHLSARSPDEEDESGEEQISSALFVPHKTPHESPDRERVGLKSPVRPRLQDHKQSEAPNSQEWLEEYEVPSRDEETVFTAKEPKPLPKPATTHSKPQTPYSEKGTYFSEPDVISDIDNGTASESGYTTGEESAVDDHELTPTGSLKRELAASHISFIHDHQQVPRQPLEAIELIPYRHQVGGHTTMWRFSKRAVCKQLNNRENEFYEKIERYHPRLLKFLPRYIYFLFRSFFDVRLNAESF